MVESAGESSVKLVRLLSEKLPSFRDVAEYLGHKVFLYKRAQIFIADLYDLPRDDDWLRRALRFLDLDDSSENFALPQSNVSERRRIDSPWVTRIARSPLGALVRDMLPGGRIQQLKNLVADPAYAALVKKLDVKTNELLAEAGDPEDPLVVAEVIKKECIAQGRPVRQDSLFPKRVEPGSGWD